MFALIACVLLLPVKSFDPFGENGLEGLIMNDLYGSKTMPTSARPVFEFMFLLFDLLSILSLAAQWMVIQYGLEKKEKWALWYMILMGLGWPVGACGISIFTGAYAYLFSAGIMIILFSLPLLFIYFSTQSDNNEQRNYNI